MRYSHRFRVGAPLARVAEFHRRSDSLRLLTPPPAMLRILDAPRVLGASDLMRFSMGLGAARVDWVARIEESSESGFVDRQLAGPFAEWTHRHRFVAIDPQTTEVRDEIAAELRIHPLWGPVGLAMWVSLPALFAYRCHQTRRLIDPRTRRI